MPKKGGLSMFQLINVSLYTEAIAKANNALAKMERAVGLLRCYGYVCNETISWSMNAVSTARLRLAMLLVPGNEKDSRVFVEFGRNVKREVDSAAAIMHKSRESVLSDFAVRQEAIEEMLCAQKKRLELRQSIKLSKVAVIAVLFLVCHVSCYFIMRGMSPPHKDTYPTESLSFRPGISMERVEQLPLEVGPPSQDYRDVIGRRHGPSKRPAKPNALVWETATPWSIASILFIFGWILIVLVALEAWSYTRPPDTSEVIDQRIKDLARELLRVQTARGQFFLNIGEAGVTNIWFGQYAPRIVCVECGQENPSLCSEGHCCNCGDGCPGYCHRCRKCGKSPLCDRCQEEAARIASLRCQVCGDPNPCLCSEGHCQTCFDCKCCSCDKCMGEHSGNQKCQNCISYDEIQDSTDFDD